MKKREYKIILTILILIFFTINYNNLDSFVTKNFDNQETIVVERVIDGDTLVDSEGIHYRLLGINTPEKGEPLYLDAKKFLEEKTINQTIIVEKTKKDRYDRELAYFYLGKANINEEIVNKGYANYYFPEGKDRYYSTFLDAWLNCIDSNINLCEKSEDKCSSCIQLTKWDFENQEISFYNKCSFDCNLNGWTLKDEGRKKFVFENYILKGLNYVNVIVENKTNSANNLYWKNEEYVWTSSGDSFFLRDGEGKLVLWGTENY